MASLLICHGDFNLLSNTAVCQDEGYQYGEFMIWCVLFVCWVLIPIRQRTNVAFSSERRQEAKESSSFFKAHFPDLHQMVGCNKHQDSVLEFKDRRETH